MHHESLFLVYTQTEVNRKITMDSMNSIDLHVSPLGVAMLGAQHLAVAKEHKAQNLAVAREQLLVVARLVAMKMAALVANPYRRLGFLSFLPRPSSCSPSSTLEAGVPLFLDLPSAPSLAPPPSLRRALWARFALLPAAGPQPICDFCQRAPLDCYLWVGLRFLENGRAGVCGLICRARH